jgi:hypothetical protein
VVHLVILLLPLMMMWIETSPELFRLVEDFTNTIDPFKVAASSADGL